MRPVMTSTDGRCVARIRWMPTARAICARRQIDSSTSLPATIIRSASSSMTTMMKGSGFGSSPFFTASGFSASAWPDVAVVLVDVADALGRERLVALLHLAHRPAQRVRACFGSTTTGVSRCGMSSYIPSSRRLGSIMISRTSSGVAGRARS
jgi:hypothetical protein